MGDQLAKDNTQWLILKAQELWPQHQQQAGSMSEPDVVRCVQYDPLLNPNL